MVRSTGYLLPWSGVETDGAMEIVTWRLRLEVIAVRSIKQWRVEIMIGENEGHTYAEARLVTEVGDRLLGVGQADVSSRDTDVPEIGDEVAVARALRDLGSRLLGVASSDIGDVTDEDVHLAR